MPKSSVSVVAFVGAATAAAALVAVQFFRRRQRLRRRRHRCDCSGLQCTHSCKKRHNDDDQPTLRLRIAHSAVDCPPPERYFVASCDTAHVLRTAPRDDRGPLQQSWAVIEAPPTRTTKPRRGGADTVGGLRWTEWDVLYPRDAAAFDFSHRESPGDSLVPPPEALYHCYLAYFCIKPECVAQFEQLLLRECAAVMATEPGMLRYDLLKQVVELSPSSSTAATVATTTTTTTTTTCDAQNRSTSASTPATCETGEPTNTAVAPQMYIVYEVCRDDAAMAVHEGRRASEKPDLRAALAPLESVSRKLLPHYGRYVVHNPASGRGSGAHQQQVVKRDNTSGERGDCHEGGAEGGQRSIAWPSAWRRAEATGANKRNVV